MYIQTIRAQRETITRQLLLDDPFAPNCSLSLAMALSEKAPLNPQKREDPVLPTALRLPVFNKLKGAFTRLHRLETDEEEEGDGNGV